MLLLSWNQINLITKGCFFFLFFYNSTVVLGAYQDEATNQYRAYYCDTALELIGGRKPFQREYRASFTIVGYKGQLKPIWIKQKMSSYGRGPTDLNGVFKLM